MQFFTVEVIMDAHMIKPKQHTKWHTGSGLKNVKEKSIFWKPPRNPSRESQSFHLPRFRRTVKNDFFFLYYLFHYFILANQYLHSLQALRLIIPCMSEKTMEHFYTLIIHIKINALFRHID